MKSSVEQEKTMDNIQRHTSSWKNPVPLSCLILDHSCKDTWNCSCGCAGISRRSAQPVSRLLLHASIK